MAISIEHAYLLAMVLSAAFYGAFVVLYLGVVYILFILRKDTRGRKSAAMFIVTVMLLVATLHLAVSYVRTATALINKWNEPGGALVYLNTPSVGSFLFQDSLYAVQTLLGDAFIVYRLYVVYAGDKRVVLPAITIFVGSAAVAVTTLVLEGLSKPGSSVFTLNRWVTSFFVFTFVTNITCTGMVAFKLYSVERKVYRAKNNRYLTRIAITLVESGSLYSIFLVPLLITYIKSDFNVFIPFLMLPHVIGIAFSLVMIRVGLGISFGDASHVSVSEATGASVNLPGGRSTGAPGSFGMVHISRVTEVRHCDFDTNSESEATMQKGSQIDFDQRSLGDDVESQRPGINARAL